MTTISPRAALTACIDALSPPNNVEEETAVAAATAALRANPVPFASLETAACLWEAVLDLEARAGGLRGKSGPINDPSRTVGQQIAAAREANGTNGLRLTVLRWVNQADAAWSAADINDEHPRGGAYGDSFDWDFIPAWIMQNVDWSDAQNPHVIPARIPVMAPGEKIVVRSPLDELTPDLRKWLVDDMGMEAEIMGGGAFGLRHAGPDGSSILVTCLGGGGFPKPLDWHVGAYGAGDDDAILQLCSDEDKLTLEMAIGAACGLLADYTAPPSPVSDAAMIADGVGLLDAVHDAYADDGICYIHMADKRVLRVTVEAVSPAIVGGAK